MSAPAAAPPAEGGNAFFPMAAGYRALALLGYLGFLGWAAFEAAANRVPDGFVMTLALAVFIAARIVPLVFHRRDYGWFHPLVFGTLVALPHLLREAAAFVTGMQVHTALPGRTPAELDRLYAVELVLTALGLGFYYLGFFVPRGPPVPALRFPRVARLRERALVVVAVSTLVLFAFVARRGGLTAHMVSWAKGRSVELAGTGYWVAFAGLGTLAALLWFALDRRTVRSPLFWAVALCVSASSFLASGSRSAVLYPILLAFMVWVFRERKVPLARGAILVAVGMTALGALGAVRQSTWTGRVDWGAAFASRSALGERTGAGSELAVRSLALRGTTAVLGHVPHDEGYIYGSSYVALLTLPVPRKLWPGKPVQVGGRMGRTFFHIQAGMPPGVIGEAYWNFGLIGIPLVYFFFGMFHRWLARFMLAYRGEPVAMALYVTVLFLADPSTGGIMATLLRAVPLAGLAVLFGVLRLRTSPRTAAAPGAALAPGAA